MTTNKILISSLLVAIVVFLLTLLEQYAWPGGRRDSVLHVAIGAVFVSVIYAWLMLVWNKIAKLWKSKK